MDFANSFTGESIRLLFDDNARWCVLANEQRRALRTVPAQSHFKVYTIFVVEVGGNLRIIEGANAEQGYIGGAICAERSAIVKLRFLDNPIIKKIIITTDSDRPVYCGALCREYLQSVCDSNVEVVLTSCNSDCMCVCSVGSLYPYPLLYRYLNRFNLVEFAQENAKKMSKQVHVESLYGQKFDVLHARALQCTNFDDKDDIHPLRFGAAVLFDDGEISVSWQKKGMEYGCTLDPVSQLVHEIEKKKMICADCSSPATVSTTMTATTEETVSPTELDTPTKSVFVYSSKPVLLVMCDQFGVCHAPVAMARSLLTEYGFDHLNIVVNDSASGALHIVTAGELMPHPNGGRPVSGLDFRR
jgi:cytidine deaminase